MTLTVKEFIFSETDLARCTAAGEYNNLARLVIANNADRPEGGTGYTLKLFTDDGRGNGSFIMELTFKGELQTAEVVAVDTRDLETLAVHLRTAMRAHDPSLSLDSAYKILSKYL